MSTYDFVFLLNQEEELANLKSLIASVDGTVTNEKTHGKKSLAYPIKGVSEAALYEWNVTLPPKGASELKKKLAFNEVLIRYLLLDKS